MPRVTTTLLIAFLGFLGTEAIYWNLVIPHIIWGNPVPPVQRLAQYLPFVVATVLVAGRLTSWRQVLVHGILVSCMAILGILTSAWLLSHVTGRSLFAGAEAGQVSMVFLLAFAGGIVWTGVLFVLVAVARRLRPSPA